MKAEYPEVQSKVLKAMSDWRNSNRDRDYLVIRSEAIESCGWGVEEFNDRTDQELQEEGRKLRCLQGF